MPNTYTQIHLQFVLAVNQRKGLISESCRERVEKYITGITKSYGHKLLSIYCMPDHAHMMVGFRPIQAISDFMREVKSRSTVFINDNKLTPVKFNWQEGYGAFSYSYSHVPRVINYILKQPEHHKKKTFKEEYLDMLNKFGVSYEEKFLFNWD